MGASDDSFAEIVSMAANEQAAVPRMRSATIAPDFPAMHSYADFFLPD
jgi:hypothetical protein